MFEEVRELLEKARGLNGLEVEEAAGLFNVKDRSTWEFIFEVAADVKDKVYGKRVVLFAPLYLSNYCTNNCLYCGFRAGNKDSERKALSVKESVKEAKCLENKGYKRLLLVSGEDKERFDLKKLTEVIRAIYDETGIRILHINAPPMDVECLKEIKGSGIGVYQIFQETYHRATYAKMHPSGRKSDYLYRLSVMDRAIEAGFSDVGIGPLLGLYDYRFDMLSAISHSKYLYREYGTHAHTLSLPRLRPARGIPLKSPPYPVSDEELKRITAVCRLALPSVGIVISTREDKDLRSALIKTGASQISAGSSTEPGGYSDGRHSEKQFDIIDDRPLEEVMTSIIKEGLMPSLCTSCYRAGRTGEVFTEKTLKGEMGNLCLPNAILTLKEYLLDHARNGMKQRGNEVIKEGVQGIKDEGLRGKVLKRLEDIENGKRDIFF